MIDATDQPQTADDACRAAIVEMLLQEAAFEGFTAQTLRVAAKAAGLTPDDLARGDLDRLFPRGVGDALRFWSEQEDQKMVEAFQALNPVPRGITAKIRCLIVARIEALDWNREAARRAASTLALPIHGTLGPELLWATADTMWRTIGDTSTDFNHYTKRTSLSAIYAATLNHWFHDEGDAAAEEPYAATWSYLDDRLENLMQFEKAKGQVMKAMPDPSTIIGFLGRLRYGDRGRGE